RNQTKEYKFYLGKTQYYSKKPEAAIINLEKIPNSGGANYLMAKSYASLNNIPKTKEYIGKAGEKNEVFWKKAKADSAFLEFRKNSEFISYLDKKIPFQPPKKEEIPKSPVAPSQTNNVLNKPKVAGSEPAKIEPKSNNVQKPQTKP
ncbi:MAG: hypothetical protein K8R21_15170, partial [Leptospira sp.]|nr:hypothetical protein [Leptospira sp.]